MVIYLQNAQHLSSTFILQINQVLNQISRKYVKLQISTWSGFEGLHRMAIWLYIHTIRTLKIKAYNVCPGVMGCGTRIRARTNEAWWKVLL